MRLILLVAILAVCGVYAAYAQPLPLGGGGVVVWTDHISYDRDSPIVVYGYGSSSPITLLVLNPSGNMADVHQLDTEGPFEVTLDTNGPYWKLDGWYRMTARAGPDSEPFSLVIGVGVGCGDREIPVDAGEDGIHCIRAESVSAATLDGSGRIMHMYVHEGGATIQIPRYLLDARTAEGDLEFVVVGEDGPVSYMDVSSDEASRTIAIQGTGSVYVSGTHAIPEFASVMLVATIALLACLYARALPQLKDSGSSRKNGW